MVVEFLIVAENISLSVDVESSSEFLMVLNEYRLVTGDIGVTTVSVVVVGLIIDEELS